MGGGEDVQKTLGERIEGLKSHSVKSLISADYKRLHNPG